MKQIESARFYVIIGSGFYCETRVQMFQYIKTRFDAL
jgi:hypothetical protein